jgi:hypothetical protein
MLAKNTLEIAQGDSMAKLGSKDRKRVLVKDKEEFIDPSFFKIQFSIKGKVFKKAVDGLLAFEVDELDDLTDADLDKALDQCSYYRFTFLAAGVELEHHIETIKRQYDGWYATEVEKARKQIVGERKVWKEEDNLPNSWIGSVTSADLKNRIISSIDTQEEYQAYMIQLSDMKRQLQLCYGLRDILQQRGGHLQSLGKRRLENRKMSFGVKDYVR